MTGEGVERVERRALQIAIVALLMLRLWMMAAYPLIDVTEARYGELARVTAEGGFWLMPHITTSTPFLAKPPLSTWMAAGSGALFGFHEFALRLPSLLMAMLSAWWWWSAGGEFVRSLFGRWRMVTTLMTAPTFVVSAGAVMTDAAQMAVVTGAMVISWRALREPHRRGWRVLFWTLLGIATLSKGPATLVLIGLPIAAYAVFGEGIIVVCRRLWSLPGLLVASSICLAWYVPAERAYPGFLSYFVIGEHFQRFLQPGWTGDRYGNAHREPLGMIWVFWMAGIGTWLPVFVAALRPLTRVKVAPVSMPDRWLWCWILTPLVFFTASRNIIMTYVLTAVPPFAVAVGRWAELNRGWLRRAIAPCALAIALVSTVIGVTWLPRYLDTRSARTLLSVAEAVTPRREVFVAGVYPFSASFYSHGTVHRVEDARSLGAVFSQPGALLLIDAPDAEWVKTRPVRELGRNAVAVLFEVLGPTAPDRE